LLYKQGFGTTVIGPNADYTNTEQGVNIETAPLLLLVTECKRSVWKWSASTRSNVGTIEKWFDDFAKCN
jgi:hypothetical protein